MPTHTADEILISPDHPPATKPLARISEEQTREDLAALIYVLENAYAGKDYLPNGEFRQLISRLQKIKGAMTPAELRDRIDAVFLQTPDRHLNASFYGDWSKARDDQQKKGQVGRNIYTRSALTEKPWFVETRTVKIRLVEKKETATLKSKSQNNILLIAIAAFPLSESPLWKGFLEKVQANLAKVDAVVIDLRGNDGGDDTTGLQLAWLFYGQDYRYPVTKQYGRRTAEAMALYANMFGRSLALDKIRKQTSPEYIVQKHKHRLELFAEAQKNHVTGYDEYPTGLITFEGHAALAPFKRPIYILMDAACASSCESTIDAFEFHPQAKRVGENTAGYIHFGNVAPYVLPHSLVSVQLGVQYSEYFDKRFIENVGLKPHVVVMPGEDAYAKAIQLLGE